MSPLFGNGSKDRETLDEMRSILNDMQQERSRHQSLLEHIHTSVDRLKQLGDPVTKAVADVDALTASIGGMERRLEALNSVGNHVQALEEQTEALGRRHEQIGEEVSTALEGARGITSSFEEIRQKVDHALALRDRMASFIEVERPFEQLRGDAEGLRSHVDGTSEQLTRLREQHDRLMDAQKLAMSKMEALDRRRDDLGRDLQDKERRVVGVEQAVRGMDGIQHTIEAVKREVGTLKALGDSVVQKTAALEAQRDAVERALAQAAELERSMRQVDIGVRQQQENEKSLNALQDQVATLKSLHESVLERSGEIGQLQRDADEQARQARQNLADMTDEMKKTVERFDFESRGLESVNQRVADLRGTLSDFENRFKTLSDSRQAVAELRSHTESIGTRLAAFTEEVGKVEREMALLRGIRRDLDQTGQAAREIGAQVAQIEQARPGVETALQHIEELTGVHAVVKDALEQTHIAHDAIRRIRDDQTDTKGWLESVDRSVHELRDQVGALNTLTPDIGHALELARRIGESAAEFEARRTLVEDMHRRMASLATLSGDLDDRGRRLGERMEAAEKQFETLESHAEQAEKLSHTVGTVTSHVREAGRKADEVKQAVAAIAARCESVEALADETRTLKAEIEQRQAAITEVSKEFAEAGDLRQKASAATKQLGELAKKLTTSIAAAESRAEQVDELSAELETRAAGLGAVQQRIDQFAERLSRWDLIEQEIARSLEQIAARQSTVETLQGDLDRMFATAEKTARNVREITSAHDEIERSRAMLQDVMERMAEVRDTSNNIEERKRQMTKAEERLARAEALLVDVRSSLETLQGQKAIVDQAVEKVGSLQFLLKQAEATIDGLREEREISARVRTAVVGGRDDEDDESLARAA